MAADPFPNIDEFGRGSCTCNGTMTGCAVCSTGNVLIRFRKPIPRLSDGTPDMRKLGARMGGRCRVADGCLHGKSLEGRCTGGTNWCAYCAYLELKANGVPVGYGRLSIAQMEAHLSKKHAIIMPGMYGRIPVVSESSYSRTVPAKGRSDRGFTGAHMMVVWGVASRYSDGRIKTVYVSDADFGSPSRPIIPPHSVITWTAIKAYWQAVGSWPVCYTTVAPPAITSTAPALPYGAVRYADKLRFKTTVAANERPQPRIPSSINSVAKAGTTIQIDRYTKAGTNVGGSATWYGTDDGNEWFHSSVVTRVGLATGTETIR